MGGSVIIRDAIDEFLLYQDSVRGLSENTVLAYRNDLGHFAELLPYKDAQTLDITAVTKEDVLTTIGRLSRLKRSAASINRYIAAVRTLFMYCRKCGYTEINIAAEIRSVKMPKRMPKFLTVPEVDALCAQPAKKELQWEMRDKAILEMLYSSGCRVSELCSLRLCDMAEDASSAIVMGKGKRERKVFFEKDARAAFKAYIADRKKFFSDNGKKDDVPYVFVNMRMKPMRRANVYKIVSRYSGVEGTNHRISPHTMRHTFATAMVANGADVRIVQEMLGHKRIAATQKYTHITTEQLLATYNKAHPHSGK